MNYASTQSSHAPEPGDAANRFSALSLIRVYDEVGNVIETHDHKGDFKAPQPNLRHRRSQSQSGHAIIRLYIRLYGLRFITKLR
jgi:hypothetical protein